MAHEYMRQVLGEGGEGPIVCNKGCRLQVDSLKEQVQLLSGGGSVFKVCLNRLIL